ncbi:helix-turn-helix domain-containing protein [Arthrobacter sp. SA17]
MRAWLGENGSWDATAKALGLHRNSVRRQINALGELLDMDLNQARVRAELWFALEYADEVPGLPEVSAWSVVARSSQER